MRPLRGIIFDFDGTILDTETPEYEAWQAICAEHGVTLPIAVWATGVGIGMDENPLDIYAYLAAHADHPLDVDAVRERRRTLFAELLTRQHPRPGILSLLADATERGLQIGLASSSGHDWVDNHLARLGLLSFFPVRLCADDVTHTKPNPELYVRCLSALGCSADEVFALEDSPNGIRAAKAAGLYCIAYPNPLTKLLTGIESADVVTEDPDDLSLSRITARRQ
ncbi:MAG: HAD family hydrolase [Akkermansiaceae bacterium]|nr:HAD family hydrolase [Armatimonadota bacterium]